MKTLSPGLQAHLDAGTTTLAWCWRISRADGVALGFTDHDRALAFDGTEFEPESGLAASETGQPLPHNPRIQRENPHASTNGERVVGGKWRRG